MGRLTSFGKLALDPAYVDKNHLWVVLRNCYLDPTMEKATLDPPGPTIPSTHLCDDQTVGEFLISYLGENFETIGLFEE